MPIDQRQQAEIVTLLRRVGSRSPENVQAISQQTGVGEAEIYRIGGKVVADHGQVLLGRPTKIDRDIAELIELCWKLGFDTDYSCQGEPLTTGTYMDSGGYISFVRFEDCREFARIVRSPGSPLSRDKGRPIRQMGMCVYFAWRVIPDLVAALRLHAQTR